MNAVIPMLFLLCTLSQYSPGTMESTVAKRQSDGLIAQNIAVDGFLATRDCENIGDIVWIRKVGQRDWEMFAIADCAMPKGTDGAFEWMTANSICGEVGHATAKRWNTVDSMVKAQFKNGKTESMPIILQ